MFAVITEREHDVISDGLGCTFTGLDVQYVWCLSSSISSVGPTKNQLVFEGWSFCERMIELFANLTSFLATGGFGAHFISDSLLAQYRPDLILLPTTDGVHCTGEGIKMGEQIGAKIIDLEGVQVHPTGLVKPDDPDAKIKFPTADVLRGVGGLVFYEDGELFCNELGRRDYVTGEMMKNKALFRLCLNNAAAQEVVWHGILHYTGRGVMKYYASGEALAQDRGCNVQKLVDAYDQHYAAAMKTEENPTAGPF